MWKFGTCKTNFLLIDHNFLLYILHLNSNQKRNIMWINRSTIQTKKKISKIYIRIRTGNLAHFSSLIPRKFVPANRIPSLIFDKTNLYLIDFLIFPESHEIEYWILFWQQDLFKRKNQSSQNFCSLCCLKLYYPIRRKSSKRPIFGY
jgi:hypothetical protein